jgi:beta-barrel assembly-enhancing protease
MLLIFSACSHAETQRDEMQKLALAKELTDELEVGRGMAAKLIGHFGLYEKEPQVLKYVRLIGLTVAQQSSRSEIDYKFGILDTDEINAYAVPGGFIFLTKGLLAQVQTESELAAILGHEIAHVTEKHMYHAVSPKREETGSDTVVRVMSRGRSSLGASILRMVNQGMEILLEKGIDHEKEMEADQVGTMYALAAGYHPLALHHFLKRTHSPQSDSHEKLSKTHPPIQARLEKLENFYQENGIEASLMRGSPQLLQKRFQKIMGQRES